MQVGIISDTHVPDRARKLPEWLFEELEGSELILHAGDVTSVETFNQLEKIAPVKAVQGNCDSYKISDLPVSRELTLAGAKIAMTHSHKVRGETINGLQYMFPDADLIIFGHTHDAYHEKFDGQDIINPGSPTSRKRMEYYSAVVAEIDNGIKDIRFIKKYQ